MKIASALTSDMVFPRQHCASKKQLLRFLSEQAETRTGIDAGEIFSVIMEREQACITVVGEGTALPQARLKALTQPVMLATTLERPIEFGAQDGKPVDIVVLLLTPETANTDHVKAVAAISRLLRDSTIVQALRTSATAEELYNVLTYGG